MKKNGPVQHDGEYVLTKDGNKDFGEISPETAGEIQRQAGKIRLRIGVDVKTGLIARKNYFKNKTPLWVKPQNGV